MAEGLFRFRAPLMLRQVYGTVIMRLEKVEALASGIACGYDDAK